MFDKHRTKDGHEILIAQMADSHLVNMIRTLCNRLKQARLYTEQPQSFLYEALGVSPEGWNRDDAIECIRWVHAKLPPYVTEAALRGLAVSEYLSDAYGRSTQVQPPQFPRPAGQLKGLLNTYSTDGFECDFEDDEF